MICDGQQERHKRGYLFGNDRHIKVTGKNPLSFFLWFELMRCVQWIISVLGGFFFVSIFSLYLSVYYFPLIHRALDGYIDVMFFVLVWFFFVGHKPMICVINVFLIEKAIVIGKQTIVNANDGPNTSNNCDRLV